MNIDIRVALPEDVAKLLNTGGGDLSRTALESIALEGYRSDRLTGAHVMRLLGFQTRMELDSFLKEHDVYLNYTLEDLEREAETLIKIGSGSRFYRAAKSTSRGNSERAEGTNLLRKKGIK